MMSLASAQLFFAATVWTVSCTTVADEVSNTTELLHLSEVPIETMMINLRNRTDISPPRARRKRYISNRDMKALVDYHNLVRSQVFPPASNMEYMVGLYLVFVLFLEILSINILKKFVFFLMEHS